MFKDRLDAGKQLAQALRPYKGTDAVVLGLPRGGVVLAAEVAKELALPLDIICPRKIGAPYNPEFAIGAITETGEGCFNQSVIQQLRVPEAYLAYEIEKQKAEAARRLKIFRGNRKPLNLENKIAILVDDGLATGLTMKAAIATASHMGAAKIVVAVPVAPTDTAEEIAQLVPEFVCLGVFDNFYAVGQYYQTFPQTTDSEVIALLNRNF